MGHTNGRDEQWVEARGSAREMLEAQGYRADTNARGRRGWVLMVKDLTDNRKGE
jgi:hypothetical protein